MLLLYVNIECGLEALVFFFCLFMLAKTKQNKNTIILIKNVLCTDNILDKKVLTAMSRINKAEKHDFHMNGG